MRMLILFIWFLAYTGYPQERPFALSRALLHNTVRIESVDSNGVSHIGTGFFYDFEGFDAAGSVPVIVTCWHVVSNGISGKLYFAQGSSNALVRVKNHLPVTLTDWDKWWVRHPDTNVDLAIMPLAQVISHVRQAGISIDRSVLTRGLIPSDSDLGNQGAFQEVKFVGYPIGIWDDTNNLPIARRGMTATDLTVDYRGRPIFLVDAIVFPGSSGSPVYAVDEGPGFQELPDGSFGLKNQRQVRLLGVLYAVYEYPSDGKVDIQTIPTTFDIKVTTKIPAGLGLVIKATQLKAFQAVVDQRLGITR